MQIQLMGICCDKDDNDDETSTQANDPDNHHRRKEEIIINNRWQIIRQVGKGGYGKVYQVSDINDKSVGQASQLYAMKVERMRERKPGRLPQEWLVLDVMHKTRLDGHVVKLYDKGMVDNMSVKKSFQFMVMTLLGPSLADLRKIFPGRKFSAMTTAMIGEQIMDAIEELHLVGYIHRDIKPHNFMVGLHKQQRVIFLIDFGMARKIFDENGHLLKIRTDGVPFRGTLRYCAMSVHEHREYGRHHDLWSIFHTLIESRTGRLPWNSVEGDSRATYRVKSKIIAYRWLKDVEEEYLNFYEYLTSLHYDMKPNYGFLKKLLGAIVRRENVDNLQPAPFDWESGGKLYERIQKATLTKMFHYTITEGMLN